MSEKLEIDLRKKLNSRNEIFFKNFDFKTGVQSFQIQSFQRFSFQKIDYTTYGLHRDHPQA